MEQITPFRALVALLTTFGGGWLAYALGAPVPAIVAVAAGAFLGGVLVRTAPAISEAFEHSEDEAEAAPLIGELPTGPTLEDLMDALDDPTLLIVNRRVERANPAALTLLGDHIVGEDARLAIRHPGAAELLVGDTASTETRTAIELMGIGERQRSSELIIHRLAGNARLVRLADRSAERAAEKMRVDFVANASHELRTPLSSLLGYIETLQDGAAKEKRVRKRFLDIMHSEASRMQGLIADLMSLSRIEAEKYQPLEELIDLHLLLNEASEAVCEALDADPERVIIDADKDAEHEAITGDRGQLLQLARNLIGNALKYGGENGTVTVELSALPEDMVRLTVSDKGEGIPAEHLPRLTERFYRADPGRSRSMGGTGLGLAIVKHIVERHRGRLDIASTPGIGTTVIVDLPKNPRGLSSARNEKVTKEVPGKAT